MQKGNTITIPRKEYEEYKEWRGFIKTFKTSKLSPKEARELKKAREEYKRGDYSVILDVKEYKRLLEAAEEKGDLQELQRIREGKTSFRELSEYSRARV